MPTNKWCGLKLPAACCSELATVTTLKYCQCGASGTSL
jgi:hypothetical protein